MTEQLDPRGPRSAGTRILVDRRKQVARPADNAGMVDDPASIPALSVLAVDDEESTHRVLALHLPGIRLVSAYNGWEARELAATARVDVIILDLNLPDVPGLELLPALRRESPGVPVVILTGDPDYGLACRAGELGAVDFVAKSAEEYPHLRDRLLRVLAHAREAWPPRPSRPPGLGGRQRAPRLREQTARAEREALRDALRAHRGDRDAAARALDVSRATLYRLIRKYQPDDD